MSAVKAELSLATSREVFDAMIEQTTDPDLRAQRELCREFFCNPEFRKAFEEHTFNLNQGVKL